MKTNTYTNSAPPVKEFQGNQAKADVHAERIRVPVRMATIKPIERHSVGPDVHSTSSLAGNAFDARLRRSWCRLVAECSFVFLFRYT